MLLLNLRRRNALVQQGHPIDIADGRWADEPVFFKLVDDETQWYMNWTKYPEPEGLSAVISSAESYGFSFVGFKGEVNGRLSLGGLEISKHQ